MTNNLRPSCVCSFRLRARMSRIVGVAACVIAFSSSSLADEWRVTRASGDVRIKGEGVEWVDLATRRILPSGYSLSTGWNGRVLLRRGDERLLLSPRMSIVLPKGSGATARIGSPVQASAGQAGERPATAEPGSLKKDVGSRVSERPSGEVTAKAVDPRSAETETPAMNRSVASAADGTPAGPETPALDVPPKPRPRMASADTADSHPLKRAMTTFRTVTTTLRDGVTERPGNHLGHAGRAGAPTLMDRIRQGSE